LITTPADMSDNIHVLTSLLFSEFRIIVLKKIISWKISYFSDEAAKVWDFWRLFRIL